MSKCHLLLFTSAFDFFSDHHYKLTDCSDESKAKISKTIKGLFWKQKCRSNLQASVTTPKYKNPQRYLLVGWFPTYNLKQLETSSAEIMSPPELVSTHFWLLIRPRRRAVSLEGTFQTEHDTRNRWSIPKGVACLRELRVNCLKLCKNFVQGLLSFLCQAE